MVFDIDKKNGPALTDDAGNTLTYQELATEITLAGKCTNMQGKLCFCLSSNTIGSVIAYLSALEHNMPAALLDSAKDQAIVSELANIYQPNFIWAPQTQAFANATEIYRTHGYILWQFSDNTLHIHPSLALLLPTSGSTGSPKFVRLSLANIVANALSIVQYLGIDSSERPVTSLPMHYSYGLSVINSHLLAGANILLTEHSILQREFWNFVQQHEATSLSGVPYTYEMLKRLRFFRMSLPSLTTLTQAGGKLNPKIVGEFAAECLKNGKRFIVMYGQTEATARMSYLPTEYAMQKPSSIGIPVPGGKFTIVGTDGTKIESPGTEGELIYQGDNVSLGYALTPDDLAKGDENNKLLHTGDIAMRDSDNFYYITGRMKRFIKIWGNRCSLDAIEQILKPKFCDIACEGVDDLITVFTTCSDNINEIKQLLVRKTGFHTKAFNVKVLPEIPVSSSGKILYAKLRDLL
ncbi:AMP-binding protein [uncultured Muribaculum sp.]|uniref:AMP-binding protein n=2 Tax=uncultured Muribaculum sp. TaxID=1918613 RepID=UPI0026709BCD|nr:AMP-binding protein [uncultured Muribaculum sp.]